MQSASTLLREMIGSGEIWFLPGVYDGLSARIAQNIGAKALYASGGAIARSTGVPDMGLLSLTDVANRLEQIVDAVDLPVIADMDTGFGNALNARRALRAFERAGVGGFHIEDQVFPKRCGHYEGKAVIPLDEFCAKIRALRDAQYNEGLLIIARTDALVVDGVSAALDRMHRAMEAGADMVFVEALRDLAQIERVAKELPYPKLLNMFWGGKTPVVPKSQLQTMGYNFVIVPGDLQRIAINAMQRAARAILEEGHTMSLTTDMASFEDREAAVATEHYMQLDQRYSID